MGIRDKISISGTPCNRESKHFQCTTICAEMVRLFGATLEKPKYLMQKVLFARMLATLQRLLRKRRDPEPQDPYAYVTAPRKPRPNSRSGAAVAELPEE